MSRFRASHNKIFGGLTVDGAWSAGYLGNDGYIPLLGTDFNVRSYTLTVRQSASIEGQFSRSSGGSIRTPAVAGASYAMKIIPRSYEAFAYIVYGSLSPYGVRAFSSALDSDSVTNLQAAPVAQNITHTFDSVVPGDGSTYVAIYFEPIGSVDEVFGGKIFIRKKT
jgi:hypothetical protein